MNFESAFSLLIGHEAGFQNDPADKGNWTGGRVGVGELKGTKYGVSAASYPGEDIKNLTLERARFIYQRDFWGPAGCDVVPDELKFDLFDTAVHTSAPGNCKQAIRLLQRAVGAADDGILGPRTLMAVQGMDPLRALARFNGHRLDHLNDNPETWARFGRGWAQRIADNLKRA